MFALTKKYFDAWLHIIDLSVTWSDLNRIVYNKGWSSVYVSIYNGSSSLDIKNAPKWAIPVLTYNLSKILENHSNIETKIFDSWIDVEDGPQRLDDVTATHQIRLLTSISDNDKRKVRRFILASTFSPFMWRLVIQDRDTLIPLPVECFTLRKQKFPILGIKEYNNAKHVGSEYQVTKSKSVVSIANSDTTINIF